MKDIQTRSRIAATLAFVFLIAFFLGTSIALGGALYSSRVVEDLWSSSPPESLRQWSVAMNAAGLHFWRIFTPLTMLLALLTLATTFATPRRHRAWRIAACILFLSVAVSSLAYFAPTIARLSPPALDQLSADEASAMVHRWIRLDTFRMAAVALAWACGLRSIVSRGDDREVTAT